MSRIESELYEIVKTLPPDKLQEVKDFAEFLNQKKVESKRRFLKQDWAGALTEYNEKYTALELQKKAIDWRFE